LRICVDSDLTSSDAFQDLSFQGRRDAKLPWPDAHVARKIHTSRFKNLKAAGMSEAEATAKTEQGASKSEPSATSAKNNRERKDSVKSLEAMVSPRSAP
jgi:hypothetical protein